MRIHLLHMFFLDFSFVLQTKKNYSVGSFSPHESHGSKARQKIPHWTAHTWFYFENSHRLWHRLVAYFHFRHFPLRLRPASIRTRGLTESVIQWQLLPAFLLELFCNLDFLSTIYVTVFIRISIGTIFVSAWVFVNTGFISFNLPLALKRDAKYFSPNWLIERQICCMWFISTSVSV